MAGVPGSTGRMGVLVAARAASGAMACASLLYPWARDGLASSSAAHRLADLAIAGHAQAFVTPWLGRCWYLIGLCGALYVVMSAAGGRTATVARALLAVVALVLFVVLFNSLEIGTSVAAGALLALLGIIGMVTLGGFDLLSYNRRNK